MSCISLMSQALDYIERHLQHPIGVADIAQAVNFSLFYFCRTFSRTVHHTPYDYLMRRRLTEAAGELISTDDRIIDIAQRYQFGRPETFSRAFRRLFQVQPSRYRQRARPDWRQFMPPLTCDHLQHIHQPGWQQPEVQEWPGGTLQGVMTLVQDRAADIPTIWEWLQKVQPAAGDHYWGLRSYPPDWPTRPFSYLAGLETTKLFAGDTPLVNKSLGPLLMLHLAHLGPPGSIQLSLDYAFHTWLPNSRFQPAGSYVLEFYGSSIPDAGRAPQAILIPITPLAPAPEDRPVA